VNGRVIIEASDMFEELGLGDRLGELKEFAVNTCLGAISWEGGNLGVGRLLPRQLSTSYEHKLLYAVRVRKKFSLESQVNILESDRSPTIRRDISAKIVPEFAAKIP